MEEKNVLLIAPLFFGYYKSIKEELENLGCYVEYICDSPSNSNLFKAIGRINKKSVKHSTTKYFNNTVLPIVRSNEFDYVFVVAGMTFSFTSDEIKQIRDIQNNAKFVMYQWDSEKNISFVKNIHQYFDNIFSFDRFDCLNNSKYIFLPLFYTKIYENIELSENFKYDCSYVGTAHPQKYKDINLMAAAIKDIMPKQYIYHYMPSKLKYIYHKLTAKEYKGARYSEFKTERLSSSEMMQIFKDSECILDAPQAGQTGLTIRSIECLGAKRKLITTNNDIVNYDFYRPENIYVYDGEIDRTNIFFKSSYVDIGEDIYKKYSLKNWLIFILEKS